MYIFDSLYNTINESERVQISSLLTVNSSEIKLSLVLNNPLGRELAVIIVVLMCEWT